MTLVMCNKGINMTTIRIDPVTRISGLLNIEVQVENNKIVDAKVSEANLEVLKKCLREGRHLTL